MNIATRISLIAMLALAFACSSLSAQTDFWQHLEKPYGGGVFVYAFAPNGDILVGSEFDGTFRSTDNGLTWKSFGTGDGIFILGANAQGIYGMTDDRGGAYRSTDDGATWERRSAGIEDRKLRYMTLAPNGHLFIATDSGVYRSADGAGSWSLSGLADDRLDAIFASPGGSLFAIIGNILYRSGNDGATWARSDEGLWDTEMDGIAFGEQGKVLVLVGNRIFSSTDDGVTFDTAVTLPFSGLLRGLAIGKDGSLFTIERSMGALRLSASGDSLTQLNLPTGDITTIAVASNGNVLAGFERRGIYTSTNNGGTWSQTGLAYGADISALAEIGGSLYAAVGYGGLYRSTDGGENWKDIRLPENERIIAIDTTADGTIFIGAGQGSAFRSTDNGSTWKTLEVDFQTDVNDQLVTRSGAVLIASNDGVVRSIDKGDHWFTMIADENVYAIAQAPNGDLWGVGFERIYRSVDDGLTWTTIPVTGNNLRFSSLGILPDGSVIIGAPNKTLRSTDNGATWNEYSLGCSGSGEFDMIAAGDGAIYMTNSCGIYRLTGGTSWSLVAEWPDPSARAAFLVTSARRLYAGGGRGLYRSQSALAVRETRSRGGSDLHLTIAPNPARSRAAITFVLPKSGPVTLTVSSVRGDAVTTLVDAVLQAGEHTIEWSAEGIPSGVYIYQLRSDDATGTGMIEVMR